MASELFWTAFAAIGQAVGAIATAAAVIVTLWQVRYSNKKKLKMKFTDKNVVFSERGDSRYFFVNLSVSVETTSNVLLSHLKFKPVNTGRDSLSDVANNV